MINQSKVTVAIQPEEYWYGGCVSDGVIMPYGRKTEFRQSLKVNNTNNQAAPLLISSLGRYLWCESGFDYTFHNGQLTTEASGCEIILEEGCENLKGALLTATKNHFQYTHKAPPPIFFTTPQYNTWIEFMYHQNQKDILEYARRLIESGMPVGLFMIDCGWAEYNGCLEFHSGRFPDPRAMMDRLHEKGFKVMLWESPFITADSAVFRELAAKGYLIRDHSGEPAIKHWWDGYSAVLDMTNPEARRWLMEQNRNLMSKYGVDGFKMDAGDARYYSEQDCTCNPVTPNGHSALWAKFGLNYEYNEYRACFQCSGEPLVQRLADKCHSWKEDGLRSLVPNMLAQGILGYPYGCPDMIGGGEYSNFLVSSKNLDQELVVRYAQCSALMPMMQFSAAPWRILDDSKFRICRETALLHVQYGSYIYDLACRYAQSGEPIIRYLEYEFPHQGLAKVTDQFMLGDALMAVPVLDKGAASRKVVFPAGVWRDSGSNRIQGPCERNVPVSLQSLPLFFKENTAG